MREILPLLVAGFLVLSGLGAVALSSNVELEHRTSTVSFSQLMITEEKEYVSINIDEANSFIMEQGKPMLPCYTEKFTFPFGTKIKSVTCTPSNIELQTVSKYVEPTPQVAIVGQTLIKSKEELMDYGTDLYPSGWFEYTVSGGLVNGDQGVIVDVQVNPVKYHPAENTIQWAKDVNIEIEYELPTEEASQEDYELIIIGPDEYSDELAPLVNWKNDDMGLTTKFAGLSEVYSGTGRDNAEKIKYYIYDAVENDGTNYVLLVGSATKLPARSVHIFIDRPPGEPDDDEIFVSDLYYADIYDGEGGFASWDTNDNDIFGEYDWEGEYDEMDLHADVFLGRLAATTGSQVTNCVNKIMTYEYEHAYEKNWFKNLVVVGGDSFPDDDDYLEGEEGINERVMNMMDDFTPDKLWVTNGRLTQPGMGVTNLKNAINAGCGFVDFSGHGNPSGWATHPWKNFGTWVPTPWPGGINNNDISTLSNQNKLPIVVVEACSTSKFPSNSNCFNWAFLHNANGGAIGSFGAAALGWGYTGKHVYIGGIGKIGLDAFRAYASDDSITLGEMWVKNLERFIGTNMDEYDYKTCLEWQIFGDPSLMIGPESGAPEKPDRPSGPTHGEPGITYTFSSRTTDPEGNKISYLFDWGDGTDTGWIGPYNSGDTASATHAWSGERKYEVKVKAKDDHGKESLWSDPLVFSTPRARAITDGTFGAELGLRGNEEPFGYLEGTYNSRGRFKVVSGTASVDDKEGRFRGIFFGNHFIIRIPTPRNTINLLGRVVIEDQTFEGNWISRAPYARGWITGEFTPS